jgi:CRISPR/Cas system CSM-associated protein Csm3 (group 7 of RAMP superfamily)
MHRTTYNELRLDVALTTASPISVQMPPTAGTLPRVVRSPHPETGTQTAYIPGGTLKGMLRRAAEQIFTGAGLDCCDSEHPCSERESVKRASDGPSIYKALCNACRLFGSPVMRSRLAVTDAFPIEPVRPLTRDTANGPTEVVQDTTFYGTMALKNFERWQVGLLSLLWARVNLADVQIGAYRSEGLGCLTVQFRCLTLLYPGVDADAKLQNALQTKLQGVGQFIGSKNPYGVTQPDISDVPDLPQLAGFEARIGYAAALIMADDDDPNTEEDSHALIDNVLTAQALAWGSYVRAHKLAQR